MEFKHGLYIINDKGNGSRRLLHGHVLARADKEIFVNYGWDADVLESNGMV